MKFKIFISVLALGGLLLVGCDSTVYTDTKEAQAQRIVDIYEDEIADAIEKGAANLAEEMMEQEPVIIPQPAVIVPQPEPVHESSEESDESPEITLAKCLTENGTKLYTASWCGHCQNQKAAFGDGLEYLNHTDCAAFGGWSQDCTDAGVKAVPTWIFGDGTRQSGNTPLATLASLGGCTDNY